MLFTNLEGFKCVQDDVRMLIPMVEMSTKRKRKKQPLPPIKLRVSTVQLHTKWQWTYAIMHGNK